MSIPNCGFVYNKYCLVNKQLALKHFSQLQLINFKESLEIHLVDV